MSQGRSAVVSPCFDSSAIVEGTHSNQWPSSFLSDRIKNEVLCILYLCSITAKDLTR